MTSFIGGKNRIIMSIGSVVYASVLILAHVSVSYYDHWPRVVITNSSLTITYIESTFEGDVLISSMNRRNDYSEEKLLPLFT